MTSYSIKRLEKGLCPICNEGLERVEWHYDCEVVTREKYFEGQWRELSDVEIHYGDSDLSRKVTEYKCDKCQISYHVDNDRFVESQ